MPLRRESVLNSVLGLFGILATAAVIAAWWQLFHRLSNPSLLPGGFNSDSAIPLLMSKVDSFGIESLYYWSQDRISGAPFAFFSLLHQAFGFDWQPEDLARFQATWLLCSVPIIFVWTRRYSLALLWAVSLLLPRWRELIFDICQPYAWQLTWTVAALACFDWVLRRAERENDSAAPKSHPVALSVLFGFLVLQAYWANTMSGLWILGCIVLEWLHTEKGQRGIVARWALIPWVCATAVEGAFKGIFQYRYKNVHGFSVSTQMSPRLSGAFDSLKTAWAHFAAQFMQPMLVFTLAMVLLIGLFVLFQRWLPAGVREKVRSRWEEWRPIVFLSICFPEHRGAFIGEAHSRKWHRRQVFHRRRCGAALGDWSGFCLFRSPVEYQSVGIIGFYCCGMDRAYAFAATASGGRCPFCSK